MFKQFDLDACKPQRYATTEFLALENSSSPAAMKSKDAIEHWFSNHPEGKEKRDLRGRFRNRLASNHIGAFWELYLHELFRKSNYSIEIHHTVAASGKRPDFRLIRNDNTIAYVEAVWVGSKSSLALGQDRRASELMDAINSWTFKQFCLGLHIYKVGPENPGFDGLHTCLRAWIDRQHPQSPSEQRTFVWNGSAWNESIEECDQIDSHSKTWIICLRAINKSLFTADTEGLKTLQMFTRKFVWENTLSKTLGSLNAKSTKYQHLNAPYIIALNIGKYCAQEEFESTLIGGESFWGTSQSPRNRQVSAILVGVQINPWSMRDKTLQIYLNPAAEYPLDDTFELPCWKANPEDARFTLHSGRSSAEILGIAH